MKSKDSKFPYKWLVSGIIFLLIIVAVFVFNPATQSPAVEQEKTQLNHEVMFENELHEIPKNANIMVVADKGNIIYRTKEAENWSKPFYITKNNSNSATPTIAKDSENNIWVVWSEANQNVAELRYRVFTKRHDEWSNVKTFDTGFAHNAMPSIIMDKDQKLWLFWAAVEEGDDEIFYSYLENNDWRTPVKLAPDNDVPDIAPIASLGLDGYPEVDWQTFDQITFKYRNTAAKWQNGVWEKLGFRTVNPLKERARFSHRNFLNE